MRPSDIESNPLCVFIVNVEAYGRLSTDTFPTPPSLPQYIADNEVEGLLKDIVVKMCLEKPTDCLAFIRDYVQNVINERDGTSGADVARRGTAPSVSRSLPATRSGPPRWRREVS